MTVSFTVTAFPSTLCTSKFSLRSILAPSVKYTTAVRCPTVPMLVKLVLTSALTYITLLESSYVAGVAVNAMLVETIGSTLNMLTASLVTSTVASPSNPLTLMLAIPSLTPLTFNISNSAIAVCDDSN